MHHDDSPEQLLATLLDMREALEPDDACDRVRACLAERGYEYAEDCWRTFFDPEESLTNALYDGASALWGVEWTDPEDVVPRAAVLAFEAAKNTGLVLAAFALAQALDYLGDERAEDELRAFVTLHPDYEDPRLFGILGGLVANCYDDEEHQREALSFLERVGDTEDVWIQWRALATAKLGRPDEAVALLQHQLAVADRDALRVLGDIHQASGDAAQAREAYLRAVAAGDERAARRLGIMYRTDGDDHAAAQAFAVAASRGDRYSIGELHDVGHGLENEGRVEEAEVWFRLGWEAGDQESGCDLASVLERLDRLAEARRIWRLVAETGSVEAMINAGDWAASDRELPAAREYFRGAMELGTAAQRNLAAAHLGLTYDVTRAGDAAADVRGLLELGVDSLPAARAALGWLDAKAGRHADAVGAWTVGLQRAELESIASLGAWWRQGTAASNARALIERALAEADAVTAYNIGSQLAEVGELAVATRFMERAVVLGNGEDAGRWLADHRRP